jgi:CelD/BcsL family acetyltransferase involved in cellulose biosynthesis
MRAPASPPALAFARREHVRIGPLLEPVEAHWLFGSPLLGPDALELLRVLLDEEERAGVRPSVLLSGLVPESPLFAGLHRAFRRSHEVRVGPRETLCSASLAGGLDGFLARRSARTRKRLRQAERRAAAAGVTFERHRPKSAAEAAAVYARIIAVELTSWKGIGRCGMAQPGSREFYQRMLQRLAAAGTGRVILARAGERDVGFVFGGLAGAHYRGQQFSFAEDWRPFSLGNLLQQEQVRWLCEEGVASYDMGPLMDYKPHWTERQIEIGTRLLLPRPG